MITVIFIIVAIFLESTFISFPFTLLSITLLSIFRKQNSGYLAFFCGLMLDVLSLRFLGLSSLYFLLLILISGRYQKKIRGGTFMYKLLFLVIPLVIYNFLFYKSLSLLSILVMVAVGSILLFFLPIRPIRPILQ